MARIRCLILFLGMLVRRGGLAGQSFLIALSKLLGTLAASAGSYLSGPRSPLLEYLYVAILLVFVA